MGIIMIRRYLLLIYIVSVTGKPTPSSSYQYVKFIGKTPNGRPSGTSYYISEGKKAGTRTARSFFFPYELYYGQLADIWAGDLILPQTNILNFELGHPGTHITPDFSDGLSYPDPLLLTGVRAKLAVGYLYGKELFYEDVPHVRAVLRNQKQREENGLKVNKLGSLRPISPFYRNSQRDFYFS